VICTDNNEEEQTLKHCSSKYCIQHLLYRKVTYWENNGDMSKASDNGSEQIKKLYEDAH